tara:strand:- start:4157 stop:4549 length:393 start_codon:yes stop_codon:yes gene_type:complete
MSGTAGCAGGISGAAAINWVENYARPLACGLMTLYNDYIVPANQYYTYLDDENTFNTGGCSGEIVHDGHSGDILTQLNGREVLSLYETFNSIEATISGYTQQLIKAAAFKQFSDGAITIKTGTGGCDSCS